MKQKTSIFLIVLIIPLLGISQESFRIEWDTQDNLIPQGGIVDNEGNTIIVGSIRKIESNNVSDAFIFKMDSCGAFVYNSLSISMDTSIYLGDIVQMKNGNFFTIGRIWNTADSSTTYQDKFVVAIYDSSLLLKEYKEFSFYDLYKNILDFRLIEKNNGNIICASPVYRRSSHKYDLCLMEFTNTGDTVRTLFQSYDNHVSRIHDIDVIPNSANYMVLESATHSNGHPECYLLKPNLSPDTINYFYQDDISLSGDLSCDYWYPDNTYMMATTMYYKNKSNDKGFGVFKCDTLGNIIKHNFLNKEGEYDLNAFRKCMAFADEGSIYIVGTESDYLNCNYPDSIELYIVDTALNQVGYKSLGGEASYDIFGVLSSKKGGAIIYGKVYSPESNCYGNLVVYHISREEIGLPPVEVVDIEKLSHSPLVFPNPANEEVNIKSKMQGFTPTSRIKVYNSYGKKVYDYRLPNKGNTLKLNISNLAPGNYILEVTDNQRTITKGKFIKQ